MVDNLGFGAIAQLPIASSDDVGFDDSEFEDLISSPERDGVFVLELRAREIREFPLTDLPLEPLASFPIAAEYLGADSGGDIEDQQLFFADRVYSTRLQDTLFSNLSPRADLISPIDFSSSVPTTPEQGSRSQISFGAARLANGNGELNSLVFNSTIRNQPIVLRYGPLYQEIVDANGERLLVREADHGLSRIIAKLVGQDWSADRGEVTINTRGVRDVLDRNLHPQSYLGTGQEEGDPELLGRAKPLCFGDCFNITPQLINRARLIYQVHVSTVRAIDAVKDGGLPLVYIGDFPTYGDLALADIQPGEWASCLTVGMFRLGAASEYIVTCDVRGAMFSGIFTAQAGELLRNVAIQYGLISTVDLEISSLGGLIGTVGLYFDGSNPELTIADFFDLVLSSFNGWFGLSRTAQVRVGLLPNPDDTDENHTVEDHELLLFRREENDEVTRRSQSVLYDINFTPMSADQIAPGLTDPDTRERLGQEGQILKQAAGNAQLVDSGAKDFGPFTSYIKQTNDAKEVVQNIVNFRQIPRQTFTMRIGRRGITWEEGQVVKVYTPLYGFDDGKKFVITGVQGRVSERKFEMEFTLEG